MANNDVELKMLANIPIDLNRIKFHIPTLKEIITMGERKYNQLLSVILINKDFIEIEEGSELRDEITNLQLAYLNCYFNKKYLNQFKEASLLFFKEEVSMGPEDMEPFFYFGEMDEKRRLDESNFEYFQSLVMIANNINYEDSDYNPANEEARKLAEEIKKAKAEITRYKKQISNLSSKISGIAWKSNCVNIFNVFDLNIYQFYDALLRLDQVDNYQFTLAGISTGTIDAKKIKIDNYHWSKIINKN